MLILDVKCSSCKKRTEVRAVFKHLKHNYYDCFKSINKRSVSSQIKWVLASQFAIFDQILYYILHEKCKP